MDNLTNIVKLTILKLTDYKVKRDDWAKIMKNNNIPQELKHFINGVRYLYVNYMMNEINKIHNKCLRIYPVGSSNLTSDKDIQITFNLNCIFFDGCQKSKFGTIWAWLIFGNKTNYTEFEALLHKIAGTFPQNLQNF